MASSIMAEITRLDLKDLRAPLAASITDVKPLSSYNWIEAPTPTIAVPGCPPLWSPLRGSRRLQKDSGLVYIAQNAARHPESPLEPLFRAVYITNPTFDIRSIDVVTDRNNVRKLLSFIDPGSLQDGLQTFTIHIEVMQNTAIFCREEAATQEYIGPQEFRGFGHEFEKAYTSNQIDGSTGHHRVISYRFGDLNFIVRHETDGYVTDTTPNSQEPGDANLSNILASLSLSPSKGLADTTPTGSKLTIRKEGLVVPPESFLEIKTRASRRPLHIRDVAPQLWLSQTPKLVRAYHTKGTFQRPEIEDVAAEIKVWEKANKDNLGKLAALIRKIIGIVKEGGGSATVNVVLSGRPCSVGALQAPDDVPAPANVKHFSRELVYLDPVTVVIRDALLHLLHDKPVFHRPAGPCHHMNSFTLPAPKALLPAAATRCTRRKRGPCRLARTVRPYVPCRGSTWPYRDPSR
ncbi:hypothetical protein THAR02_08769 [Trichoderma harzianum]|uniref:Geranylgeranyl pyrophosphate synthetase n=1 Tax=Trichoderma harzianum TaxID=5544 RepID=A0A0F9X1N3_TRIHA|nr:hypothetical protein THAR02_08769 [Trichoderma harzianum]